jgi:hypothetical protein
LDYQSPEGPTVTHVRGTLIARGLENFKEFGVFDEYKRLLPELHRDAILYGVASSWLPLETAFAHYSACDALELGDLECGALGTMMAQRLADTWFAGALRKSRAMGFEGFRFATSKLDVLTQRMYRGGSCTVIETGPKDLIYEFDGCSLARSRYFSLSYAAFAKAAASMFCKAVFVRPVAARKPSPYVLPLAFSWI